MTEVIGVRFKGTGKVYYFSPNGNTVNKGSYVIVETAKGIECAQTVMENKEIRDDEIVQPLKPIIRVATADDTKRIEENRKKEATAFDICLQKIEKHGLDMKLTSVEYAFDNSKIVFYFTADGRVDFRELVKDLAAEFRARIELRQIGVRDEAKMLGGIGICGQPFCCSRFLDDFQPVSIKMAKEQGLSPNPLKISGSCGRLMCCLKYEQDTYEALHKETPCQGSLVETPDGKGVVVEVMLVAGKLRVRINRSPDATPIVYNVSDCKLLKRGTHSGNRKKAQDIIDEFDRMNEE